jgi:very-long-chain (3R)-3-hydroxyacyl-CoA dehydratase
VFSRVFVVWAVFLVAPPSTTNFFTLMCVTSWALVEVPRYLYLAVNVICKMVDTDPPYFFTWIRYSLFAVLYPTGITGELGCMYYAFVYLNENPVVWTVSGIEIPHHVLILVIAATYLPGAPTMIGHMVKQRKKILNQLDQSGQGGKNKKL